MQDLGSPKPSIHVTLPPLDTHLPPAYHYEALNLLEEYTKFFSTSLHNFGLVKGTSHHLELENNRFFRSQPYWKTKVKKVQVSIEVKKILEAGLLQPSKSPWTSILLLLQKKDGGHRFAMHYRRLNALAKKDIYPLPSIDDFLRVLGKYKYFSEFNLASEYWQVNLSPEDHDKCALISSEGLFEPTRMPQGFETLLLLSKGPWIASWGNKYVLRVSIP